jgi:ElaA protein
MTWTIKKFNELTPYELYAIMHLRNEVFVVEQNCVFQDADNKDQACDHVMGWDADGGAAEIAKAYGAPALLAYARIVPAGISYVESSIGRIITSPKARGRGAGRELVQRSIDALYALHGKNVIRIGAQLYLKKFYESFGFAQAGHIYIEDGIEHIEMLLPAPH